MQQKIAGLIKGWSIVVGVLSLSSLSVIAFYGVASLEGLLSLIALVLGLATAYAGFQINSMSLKTVNIIFWAKFVWLVVNFLFSISTRYVIMSRVLIIVVEGIIVLFLIQSLKKLSAPQASTIQQPPVS